MNCKTMKGEITVFKIGKKLILTLAIFGAIFGLAACTQGEDVVRVKLDKEQFELIVGHSVEVMPIVTKGGLTTEANLGYKSYDESVVTYVNGKVTAIATGETTIKVYDIDHPLAYATATVVVKAAESLNAKFSYETSMFKGEEQLIKCELQLDSLNSIVSYKSANPDVATVDENGKVVAVATGNAIILARVTASSDENVYRDYALEITVVESDYKILYELDGGVNNEANPVGYNVLELPLELLEPTKKGYTFLGWYINDEKVEAIAAGTTGDITIVAKWEKASYSIQYELDGGENATENPSEYTALDLPLTLKPATKAGYTFLGWYNGEAQVTEITESMIADLVLTAKWEKEEYALDVDLNGGEFDKTADVSNATALQEFTLSYYLSYNVNGYDACLHNSVSWGRWWYYISLKETGVNGLYEIVQIVAGSTKLTEEYDLVIGWHDSINVADRKTALFAMYNNSANYIGQYVELTNVPTEATSECNIGVTVYDASTVQIQGQPAPTFTVDDEVVLPTASKVGYAFVGWFDGETKVEKIAKGTTQSVHLVAKYDAIDYALDLQLNGGVWTPQADVSNATALQEFTLSYYLSYNVNGYDACLHNSVSWGRWWYYISLKETGVNGLYEIVQIVAGSTKLTEEYDLVIGWHDSINVADRKTALFAMYNNSANYIGQYVELTNVPTEATSECNIGVTVYDASTVQIMSEPMNSYTIEDEIVLPALTKEGYNFLGWFDGETKVEKIAKGTIGAMTLTAKWEMIVVKHNVEFELNGGVCTTLPTEYEEGKGLVLPTPTRLGYKFLGWYDNAECTGEAVTEISATANTDVKFYAKWETETPAVMHKVEFELNGGVCTTLPTEYEEGKGLVLPTPTRLGYKFLGWYDNAECTGEAVTEISATANTDVKFYAQWEEVVVHELVVDPNDFAAYQTIDAALEVANDGDTIVVKAGTFEGANITKSVTIKGANYGLNPNKDTRVDETIFTGDVVISASNVKLNGVKLTGAARIVLQENASVANTLLENILVAESTINNSKSAPFYCLPSGEGIVYSNIVINNSRIEAANTRAMIMYGSQVNGLTITNCEFLGTSGSGQYNDGIKLNADTKYEYDICGNVLIKNNKFVNYCQYPVWFSQYAEGKYEFINNTFEGSALYTNYNDACFTMNTFKSNNQGGKVEVSVLYNTIKNSGILCRIQTASLTSETATVDVHYNKLINCLHTTFISDNGTNSLKLIDATNNYYSKTPTETNFTGVSSWEPFYANEADVPLYVEEGNAVSINYELNGGTLPDNAPTEFNPDNGVQHLPTPTYEGMIFIGWMMNGVIVTEIPAGTNEDVTLVAKWREDAIYVGESTEDYVLPTLAAALEIAKAGDKIILLPGTYDESITVSIANLTIAGPNQGINPNKETRTEEAVMTGVISVASSAVNFTIDGLAFTGSAQVISTEASGNYSGFKFVNNKAYDTVEATEAWNAGRYTTTGFIEFRLASGGSTRNFTFMNNSFENVSYTNIICNRIINVVVSGNVFKDFDRDAFRTAGGYVYGTLQIVDNVFEQTQKLNGYNALFFRALAGPSATTTTVVIQNNIFKNIGTNDTVAAPYNGAISSDVFQETPTSISVENNIFDHCYNYLYLRNNGAGNTTWTCEVKNNQFLGLPQDNYFGTYKGSDNETTNPHTAVFGENYYEDNEGNVITDLTPYASMFKHLQTYGTTTSTKPGFAENIEKLEFYQIVFDADGGEIRGSYETGYTNMISSPIKLPTATKVNHNFLGWMLNGEIVTEIPTTARGDLRLVAQWQKQEGEAYDVTYNFNGGYSNDLLVANHGDVPTLPLNNFDYVNGTFWGGRYTTDIFISTPACDPTATFSDRIYIGKNVETGLYEVLSVVSSGSATWPEGAEYVITISNSYQGELGGYWIGINPITTRIKVGQMVAFDKAIETTDASNPTNVYFFDEKPEVDTLVVKQRFTDKISDANQLGFRFLGWYDANDVKWEDLSQLTSDLTLTAKWEQLNPVTSIRVDSICEKLLTGDTFQIEATVEPSDAYFKQLYFESSNTNILVVDSKGMVTALNAGKATITIWDYLRKVKYEKEVVVHAITSIDVDFEGEYDGVLAPNESVQLNAIAFGENTENASFTYKSSNDTILIVSETGLITAVSEGTANVTVTMVGKDLSIVVPVVVKEFAQDTDIDQLLSLIVANNFGVVEAGNISLYNDGVERVYVPVYGSVNRLLFDAFYVDETYYETSRNNPNNHKDRRAQDTIEFVTVHDTATLTGTVVSIAKGMSSGETSIHYTVGNDAIYGVVPEEYIAYHAGDGTGNTFTWTKTNVKATQNVVPKYEVVVVDGTTYLEINGEVSNIEIPLKGNGDLATTADLTHLGPVWKIEDGYYYIGGPLWYSYSSIASRGGNNNSIGIEMCSNLSGDIYDTFQRTAMLVVDILIRNNLDTTRVKMHNTWSGKNCPQTIISGDYWDGFMKMVDLQFEIQSNYKDARISIKSNNPDILDNTGRIIQAPAITTTVSYELTVELGNETRTITLYSVVPGTTTWEQWDGTYSASVVWNEGKFSIN